MRAMAVVVRGVAIQDDTQVPLTDDEHPVGYLCPDVRTPAFGISVQVEWLRCGAGGIRSRLSTRRTVEALTRMPRLSSSPWIRR